jgi:hypothetical protein
MRQAVHDAFPAFTDKFEGKVSWMYLDVLGLVTTGRGNLIDPVTPALALPWKQAITGGNFGALATRDQVVSEWMRVKALQSMKNRGGGAFSSVTTLRLASDDIDALTAQKLAENEEMLKKSFPGFDNWCADAQLALFSMAWAMGAGFSRLFPIFTSQGNGGHYLLCAGPPGDARVDLAARGSSWMRDGTPGQATANENPGLRPRNLANKVLWTNAQYSQDPDVLWYPTALSDPNNCD